MSKIKGFNKLYDVKFQHLIGKEIKFLEIGVQNGSSIKKWREMSSSWDVWGLDIDPKCAGHQIIIGSQEDKEVLKQFQGFDIVIDDGGHTWKQQIETFEYLFPTLSSGAIYVIEDLHTSFWKQFNDYSISTVDFLLKMVPHINHKVANNPKRMVDLESLDDLGIKAIEFYPSIVFITKE
jgi:hypothetical protein